MRSSVILFLQLWGVVEVSSSQNACSKLPDVPHAHLSKDYQEGELINFTCEPGYTTSSPTIRYVCSSEGWLTVRPGTCNRDLSPSSCNPPPADGGLTVKGLPENDDPILPDRLLTFSCEGPGKHLNGNAVLSCGQDGQWDHPFPTCEETCKVPVLSHGLQLPTHDQRDQLTTGEKLTFTCPRAADYLRGKAEVECLAGGQWSHPFPTCGAPLGCGTPPHLADGDTSGALKSQYKHGDRVEYICQNFYTKQGETRKTCINGEWTGEMRCLKPCTVYRELLDRHNIAFRFRHDDKQYAAHNDFIEFTCTKGRFTGTFGVRQQCIDGVMNLPTCQ